LSKRKSACEIKAMEYRKPIQVWHLCRAIPPNFKAEPSRRIAAKKWIKRNLLKLKE
jgi:hypothetical protein